ATRKKVRTLKGHSSTFSRIAFSPDGQTIAAGLQDGTVKLWDVATGQDKAVPEGHTSNVRCVAYSPDGKLLASVGADKMVQVYETDTDQVVQKFTLPNISDNVAFSADGKWLVSTTDNSNPSTLNVWEVGTWKLAK